MEYKCPYCGCVISGDYLHGCQECDRTFGPSFPMDDDTCELCGEKIKHFGTWGYENTYRCTGCEREWTYD